MEYINCPICKEKSEIFNPSIPGKDSNNINCPNCGKYEISRTALVSFSSKPKNIDLSFAIRNRFEDGIENSITTMNTDKIISSVSFPQDTQDKVDLILKYLLKNSELISTGLAITTSNGIIFGIKDRGDLDLVILLSESKNLLIFKPKFGGSNGGGLCQFGSNGIIRAEELLREDNKETIVTAQEKEFFNKCFLVHGRNDSKKLEVARFIETTLDKRVIILHEQASRSKTIIEKIESHSDVDFAICLYTADDIGSINEENPNLKKRARQNVVFEAGYFIGKLGRENVIILMDSDIEKPSDNDGIIYLSFSSQWKDDLRKEIEAIYSDTEVKS